VAGPAYVRGKNPVNGSITNNVSWGNQIAFFDGERSYVSQHMPIDGANDTTGVHFFNVSPVADHPDAQGEACDEHLELRPLHGGEVGSDHPREAPALGDRR
jgi:hypothetical protein